MPHLTTLRGQQLCGPPVAKNASFSVRPQSRLNVLGGPGPARLMGPLSSLWPTWRVGPLCSLPANPAIHT